MTSFPDAPTFLSLPVRPVLCSLAVFGAVRSFVQFWTVTEWDFQLEHAVVFFFHIFLLFGVVKSSVWTLKWSKIVVILCLAISITRFLIYPVVFSSLMASGISNYTDISISEVVIEANVTSPEQHFVLGMVTGFTLELVTGVSVGVELLKYVLIDRMFQYAKNKKISTSSLTA